MVRSARGGAVTAALLAALVCAAPSLAHPLGGQVTSVQSRMFGQPTRAEPTTSTAQAQAPADNPQPTPAAECGPGSNAAPGLQGRVPADAVAAGQAVAGFTCNTELLGRHGSSGGYKVLRFVDKAGRECAYYDTTLLFPMNAGNPGGQPTGVAVLDMANPSKPVLTATLATPAMQSPHESLLLNERRGLLAAVMGNPTTDPGVIDIYDLNDDCRKPALQSSSPVGVAGHESGFAPDGRTFYATSLFTSTITAVDVTNPKAPVPLWVGRHTSHGLTISDDGNRAYLAADTGLVTLDVSEIQARRPNPQTREVNRLTWDKLSIPQVALPVTIGGKPYLVEIDEFSTEGGRFPVANGSRVGAGRIIAIEDEKAPRVVSNLRLEVHQSENRARVAGDPGAGSSLQGYAGHYCAVPQREEPGIVACSFIASGLRVFDIRNPARPREIAYYVAPLRKDGSPSNYAMSSPAFATDRGEVWYSDGNSGFYALRVARGVWPFGGGGAGGPAGGPPERCLSSRLRVGLRGIGRARIGDTRARVLRRVGRPERRTRRAYRYCVRGGGRVLVSFNRRGRVELIATTARSHRARGLGRGTPSARLRRAYPRLRRAAGRGLYRTTGRTRKLFGVRAGRLRFVAVADRRILARRRELVKALRAVRL